MTGKDVVQSGNTVQGDLAAGNITHNTSVYLGSPSALRELANKFREDCEKEPALKQFIEGLQQFVDPLLTPPTRDLAAKLSDSGRDDIIDDAVLLKEQFARNLYRLQFSSEAQELYANILARLQAFFFLRIKPRIKEGALRSEVDDLVYDELCRLRDEIGSGPHRIDFRQLQGMIYFLAGNCHIRWD